VIREMERKSAVVALDTPDMGNTVGRTDGTLEGKETSHQLVGGETEEEVSSLGTGLTTFGGELFKDPHFTSFCNKKVFRYCKYWWTTRDAPAESALAVFFRDNWWED
jgi:hypothetical protein